LFDFADDEDRNDVNQTVAHLENKLASMTTARYLFIALLAIKATAVDIGYLSDWEDISSSLTSSDPTRFAAAAADPTAAAASGTGGSPSESSGSASSKTNQEDSASTKKDQAEAAIQKAMANLEQVRKTVTSLESTVDTLKAKRKKEIEDLLKNRPKPEFDRSNDRFLCEYNDCKKCTLQKGCGWCSNLQKCLQGNRHGPFLKNCTFWSHEICESGCSAFPDCTSCLKEEGCGFCTKTCSCVQGNLAGPGFNGTCGGGWFHSEAKDAATCVAAQKWPGTWNAGADMDTKLCAAKQFRLLRIRHLAHEVDRKNAIGFAKAMEDDDKAIW